MFIVQGSYQIRGFWMGQFKFQESTLSCLRKPLGIMFIHFFNADKAVLLILNVTAVTTYNIVRC
jgi:hypothetical protein